MPVAAVWPVYDWECARPVATLPAKANAQLVTRMSKGDRSFWALVNPNMINSCCEYDYRDLQLTVLPAASLHEPVRLTLVSRL